MLLIDKTIADAVLQTPVSDRGFVLRPSAQELLAAVSDHIESEFTADIPDDKLALIPTIVLASENTPLRVLGFKEKETQRMVTCLTLDYLQSGRQIPDTAVLLDEMVRMVVTGAAERFGIDLGTVITDVARGLLDGIVVRPLEGNAAKYVYVCLTIGLSDRVLDELARANVQHYESNLSIPLLHLREANLDVVSKGVLLQLLQS